MGIQHLIIKALKKKKKSYYQVLSNFSQFKKKKKILVDIHNGNPK